jgi:3-deoxy-manno-octulosonate cytidylyltransferase (CMP-KDO synthetase)
MMYYIGIIPARYASTRFPGKPLAMINGMTMIQRVYRQSEKALLLNDIYVATDDERIYKHVTGFGGKCLMTSSGHKTGTERCHEAYHLIEPAYPESETIIINIQGDEPYIEARQINEVTDCFSDFKTGIATLKKQISDLADINNPNIVKVVTDNEGYAMYFSRSPIPYIRDHSNNPSPCFKHIGIYAYRAGVLDQIVAFHPEPCENAEFLEQLRWLENGLSIKVAVTEFDNISVDTPEDLFKFVS